jgi:hypothetical protein
MTRVFSASKCLYYAQGYKKLQVYLENLIAIYHFRINVTDSFLDLSNFTPFHFPPRGKGYNTGAVEKALCDP